MLDHFNNDRFIYSFSPDNQSQFLTCDKYNTMKLKCKFLGELTIITIKLNVKLTTCIYFYLFNLVSVVILCQYQLLCFVIQVCFLIILPIQRRITMLSTL